MKLIPTIFTLLISSQIAYAGVNIDELNFVQQMDKSIEYIDTHQEAVWPGFHISTTPVLFAFTNIETNENHLIALNLIPGTLPWQTLPINNHTAYYLEENIISPNLYAYDGKMHDIDGQSSFIDNEYTQALEIFKNFYNPFTIKRATYYVASESKIDTKHLADLSVAYDGFYQSDSVKLMYLEDAALTAALQDKGDAAEVELQDAVAIHQYRQQFISKPFKKFEHAQEIFSGLPYYISFKSLAVADDEYIRKTQLTGCKPFSIRVGMDGIIECTLNGMPNFTSTTYGRALEQHVSSSAWKTTVETQFKSAARLMQEYYHMSDARVKLLTQAAMKKPRYHYDSISSTVDQIIPSHVKKLTALVEAYNNQSGVEIYTDWRWDYIMGFIGSLTGTTENYLINTNTYFAENLDGAIYYKNEKMRMEYKQLPFGYSKLVFNDKHQVDNDNSWSVFKIASGTKIQLDGKTDTVGNFVKHRKAVEFNHLIIDDAKITISVNDLAGKLDASDGSLRLKVAMNDDDLAPTLPDLQLARTPSSLIKMSDGRYMLFGRMIETHKSN